MDLRHLESLYDEFAPSGYAFALQLPRDPDAAQDLVQSVFLHRVRPPSFTILNPHSLALRWILREQYPSINWLRSYQGRGFSPRRGGLHRAARLRAEAPRLLTRIFHRSMILTIREDQRLGRSDCGVFWAAVE
jgi:DNA-directed RNA polymerase specialized sigma24 family protein